MKVFIKAQDHYEREPIYEHVRAMLDSVDWSDKNSILIKPNLLTAAEVSKNVTTHPFVVEAVARYFLALGKKVTIADSPGGPMSLGELKRTYQVTGLAEIPKNFPVVLNEDLRAEVIELKDAKALKKTEILKVALEADAIINVCKLKTHSMMTYTGAVKNLFGLIPGLKKAKHHLLLKDRYQFADHLIDLALQVKPDFSIMDAIEGMEGNGPGGGTTIKVGVLLGSENPFALDEVAMEIAAIPKAKAPIHVRAKLRGLIPEIEREGEMKSVPFKLPSSLTVHGLPRFFEHIFENNVYFNKNKCIRCGRCKAICPPQAITITDYPQVDRKKCIRCFCCHEVCPVEAIDIKKSIFRRNS
ncbi:DUF362 domain-containing protein [Guggenheimella bovis]